MDAELRVGKVHIIEWLRPGDRRTGWELFGEVEPIRIMSKPRVDVAFHPVVSRAEFVALLRAIESDFRATGSLPLLHVETHGSDSGIGISHDEGFTFPELMKELIPLNGATGLRLLVVLAACEGIWGIKMIQPAGRAAVLALIGPNRGMDDDEIAKAMQIFYRTMLREFSINRAIRATNDNIDPAKRTFGAYDAEKLFKDIYSDFFNTRFQMSADIQRPREAPPGGVDLETRHRAMVFQVCRIEQAPKCARAIVSGNCANSGFPVLGFQQIPARKSSVSAHRLTGGPTRMWRVWES